MQNVDDDRLRMFIFLFILQPQKTGNFWYERHSLYIIKSSRRAAWVHIGKSSEYPTGAKKIFNMQSLSQCKAYRPRQSSDIVLSLSAIDQ